MRKQSSVNLENEILIKENCGMAYTLDLIGGRWKPSILWRLFTGSKRYSELRKSMPNISERILILQLREMESDGLITRIVYPEVPPRVEYLLTPLGKSLDAVLSVLTEWGEANRPETLEKADSKELTII